MRQKVKGFLKKVKKFFGLYGRLSLPYYFTVEGDHAVVALCEHYRVAETVSLFGEGEAVHFVGDDVHSFYSFLLRVSLSLFPYIL
jgi:hypothetical protein